MGFPLEPKRASSCRFFLYIKYGIYFSEFGIESYKVLKKD